jgi:hypothetical protein
MKTLHKILFVLLLSYAVISCEKQTNQITHQEDYNAYLNSKENKSLDFAKSEIDFWQKKFDAAPNQITYLSQIATNYSKLFENTGKIDYLYKTEQLLLQSNEAFQYTSTGTIRSLARNYISQHRFKEALVLANKALAIGDGMNETQKLLFDVNMELGNYDDAEKNLKVIKDFKDFGYLIRISKWNDHQGDLKTAIAFMEKAKIVAESNDNKALKIWTYSNLGDLNGHNGEIQKSYNYYLKTLAEEPSNSYALKGIAWIVFSYERNPTEAKRIIAKISEKHDTPDFYLLKSKIAEFENNDKAKAENLAKYFKMLDNNKYGVMYNKYNTLLFADDSLTTSKAVAIAKIEVAHRPTPESYDLLAWSYFNHGDIKKAYAIAQQYVYGKSHEPMLNYHLAVIYKANQNTDVIAPILNDLKGSIYELGPIFEKKLAIL